MKEFLKKHRTAADIIAILIVTIILCAPYLITSVDVFIDDGIQHIARAYGTFESIKENGLFTNIINNFSNGFGYSWNLFYGPLTIYGIMLFKLITPTYIVAYKLTCYVFYALSGIFMYKLVKSLVKNNNAALLAAILYMAFPYHLTDLFTRNALGEFASFTFIPLVFLGINEIVENNKDTKYYLAYGAIGLLLVHNLSSLFTGIFAFIYLIYNFDKINKKDQVVSLCKNAAFIVLVTLFFTMPLLETKFSSGYAVYNSNMMTSEEKVKNNELNLKELVVTNGENPGFVFELGPHILIMLCLSVMTLQLITKPLKEKYVLFLFFGFISLWMCTKYFPWMHIPKQFLIIQFPWRMMMFVAFFFSIVCSINIYAIIKKFNIKDVIVISGISIIYTSMFIPTLIISDDLGDITLNENLGKFSGKENEIVAGCGRGEYLPSNAYENRFYIATRENNIYVIEGKATVENEIKNGSNYSASVQTFDSEYTIFELPYIFYPGYEIRFDGSKLQAFQTKNGFVGCVLGPNDDGDLTVSYTGTSLMKLSNFISFISFICLIFVTLKNTFIDKKQLNTEIKEADENDNENKINEKTKNA